MATGVSTLVSMLAAGLLLGLLSSGINAQGLAVSALLPILLGGPMVFFLVLREQQLKHANAQLRIMATTDGLTTCLNRDAFTHSATHHLSWPGADGTRKQMAFLVIDADDFKSINDAYGHARGDEALRAIAATIKQEVREKDLVGRIGGEEFAVLLFDVTQAEAATIAERIRTAIRRLDFTPEGVRHPLSVSIGGTLVAQPAPFDAIFRQADRHLYLAKHAGRDQVRLALSGT